MLLLEILKPDSAIVVPICGEVSGWVILVGTVYLLTAIARLKGDVVARREDRAGVAALAIHSDARMYIDRDGYADALVNHIRRSNGGVIGITGLRGAGQSALLNRVMAEFRNRYAVVSMTAPTGHREGFGFLMSVCRTICRQAIEDVSPILYGQTRDWQQAVGEFVQRSRRFLALALLIVAVGWLARSTFDSPVPGVLGDRRPFLRPNSYVSVTGSFRHLLDSSKSIRRFNAS